LGIYGWSYQSGGVHHHRIAEPLRVARQYDIDAQHGQQLDDDIAERYETILAHMLWDPRASEAWEKLARQQRHRLVLDLDDLMWHPDFAPFTDHWNAETLERLFRNIRLAHVVTVTTPFLAEQVYPLNHNVHVVPNTIPERLLHTDNPRPWPDSKTFRTTHERGRYVIGYQGSPSHSPDWPTWMFRDLRDALALLPLSWTLHFWGPDTIDGWPKARCGHTPWMPIGDYYAAVSMDIGLGPLKPSPFNRAKSGLRAIEYAALGIAGILSDTEEYRRYVTAGETGILVPQGGSWRDAIVELATQPIERARLAANARVAAKSWTTEECITNWTEAWSSA
jgi:glycosyltransferase involved in cell wall biosynthesis